MIGTALLSMMIRLERNEKMDEGEDTVPPPD